MHWSIDVDDDIKLELLDDGHAEELFRLIADGRATLDPWLPWVRGTTRPEDTSRFIERARSRWAEGNGVHAGVVVDGDLAGSVGLNIAGGAGDLQCWLHPEFRGAGVATGSCRTMIAHGFSGFDLRRCLLRIATANDRALALAERLELNRDATLRRARAHPDGALDIHVYSLLRSEWEG